MPRDTDFGDRLQDWFAANGRELPWRGTRDPYLIWISEVILQQTRVAQGWEYYERFVAQFPDVQALAHAPEDAVLRCWQGLGYYSRARNLHAAAGQVLDRHAGVFPCAYAAVRALSGVGDYTAAAICSIAYDQPHAVLDGNVFRVLSRVFDIDTPIDTAAGRKVFAQLSQELLDVRHPGLYNQAIMDFGALCCTPSAPKCDDCPLADRCLSKAHGMVGARPVKRGRTTVRERWFNYLHVTCGDATLLHRREGRDIWQGLYEFPLIETDKSVGYHELQHPFMAGRLVGSVPMPPHKLTHRTIHATVHRIEMPRLPATNCVTINACDIDNYALPRLLELYLEGLV